MKHNKAPTPLRTLILTAIFLPHLLAAGEPEFELQPLPRNRLVPAFSANGSEHRISVNRILSPNNYLATMGGVFPAANIRFRKAEAQLSIAATVSAQMINEARQIQVINTDFFLDGFCDIPATGCTVVRLGLGHTSQHLADDAFELLGYRRSINYARDYVQAFVVQKSDAFRGFLYGGFHYAYSFIIDTHRDGQFLVEIGGEGAQTPLWGALIGYIAFDLKLRQEMEFGSTQSYQAGIRVGEHEARSMRVAFTHRRGIEDRGQFYNKRIVWNMIGIYFDF